MKCWWQDLRVGFVDTDTFNARGRRVLRGHNAEHTKWISANLISMSQRYPRLYAVHYIESPIQSLLPDFHAVSQRYRYTGTHRHLIHLVSLYMISALSIHKAPISRLSGALSQFCRSPTTLSIAIVTVSIEHDHLRKKQCVCILSYIFSNFHCYSPMCNRSWCFIPHYALLSRDT